MWLCLGKILEFLGNGTLPSSSNSVTAQDQELVCDTVHPFNVNILLEAISVPTNIPDQMVSWVSPSSSLGGGGQLIISPNKCLGVHTYLIIFSCNLQTNCLLFWPHRLPGHLNPFPGEDSFRPYSSSNQRNYFLSNIKRWRVGYLSSIFWFCLIEKVKISMQMSLSLTFLNRQSSRYILHTNLFNFLN